MVVVVVVMVVLRDHDNDHVMMVVVVVMRRHDLHRTPHDPRAGDHRLGGMVNNGAVRRNSRYDMVRPDHGYDVAVVVMMVVMMMRRHHHHDVMMMVMMVVQIRRGRAIVLRLDQPVAGQFLRVGEPQPRRGVRNRL